MALYVCATPIGNLEDITVRVLRVLREVDMIACEDTRHTGKLLRHYSIQSRLTSYHDHNATEKLHYLMDILMNGQDVALVSDSGTPGISDPGFKLIREAVENGVKVTCLPGPNAAVTALVVSAFPTDRFVFEGFLPKKKKERREYLECFRTEERTIIFYELPMRLVETLEDIVQILGTREVAVVRELTKVFEEVVRGETQDVLETFRKNPPKGEITVVLKGASKEENSGVDTDKLVDAVHRLVELGVSRKDATDIISSITNSSKRQLYERSLCKDAFSHS